MRARPPHIKFLIIGFLLIQLNSTASAASAAVSASIENSHLFKGLDLTQDELTANLNFDWSHEDGLFAGLNCFASDRGSRQSLANGCNTYIGYFLPLDQSLQQALTVSLQHYTLPSLRNRDADFTEALIDWHLNQNASISLGTSNDWMGRGFQSTSIEANFRRPITGDLIGIVSAGVNKLESSAPVDKLEYAALGLRYEFRRWATEVKVLHGDSDLTVMTGFPVDQLELYLSISYQLY